MSMAVFEMPSLFDDLVSRDPATISHDDFEAIIKTPERSTSSNDTSKSPPPPPVASHVHVTQESKLTATAPPFVPAPHVALAAGAHPPIPAVTMDVTMAEFETFRGHLATIVTMATGTSYIQAALRRFPQEALAMARAELEPHMKRLLFDDHASYAVRRMMEMDESLLLDFLTSSSSDDQFWIGVFNESQHTRRLLAFFLNVTPPEKLGFLFEITIHNLADLACNKNGCLTLQRLITDMPREYRTRAEAKCLSVLPRLGLDAHGHYLMTYLTEHGDVSSNVQGIATLLSQPREMKKLACNKYGSSCVEKAIRAFPNEIGGAVIAAMNALPDVELIELSNDAFGNYIVQAVVSVVTVVTLDALVARLGTLVSSLTYGTKIFRSVTNGSNRRANPAAPQQAKGNGKARHDAQRGNQGHQQQVAAPQPQPQQQPHVMQPNMMQAQQQMLGGMMMAGNSMMHPMMMQQPMMMPMMMGNAGQGAPMMFMTPQGPMMMQAPSGQPMMMAMPQQQHMMMAPGQHMMMQPQGAQGGMMMPMMMPMYMPQGVPQQGKP